MCIFKRAKRRRRNRAIRKSERITEGTGVTIVKHSPKIPDNWDRKPFTEMNKYEFPKVKNGENKYAVYKDGCKELLFSFWAKTEKEAQESISLVESFGEDSLVEYKVYALS